MLRNKRIKKVKSEAPSQVERLGLRELLLAVL